MRAAKLILLALFGTALAGSTVHAAFSAKSAGTSGAAFLKIGAGARPSGMGEAFTSIADDVSAVYWNTAGLAQLEKNEFIAMRAQLFQELEYNFFAIAHPTKRLGTFALGVNNLNVADIPARSGDTDTPDSTFSSNDTAYTLGYAYALPMNLKLGLGLKYIHQALSGERANAFGTDLGALYKLSEDSPLSIGLAVQNLGTKSKFKSEGDDLPLTIRLGTSYKWTFAQKNDLLTSADLLSPRDNDPSGNFGLEFTRRWLEDDNLKTSVRGGYQSAKPRQISGKESGITAGAGVAYKFLAFDFAWMPFGDLGNAFRYAVKLKF